MALIFDPKKRRQRQDLPVILGHNTRTGVMLFSNRKLGGRDMIIVGLGREFVSGDTFEIPDIEWVKAVLHFVDVDALRVTVNVLTQELKRWEKEERSN